MGLLLNQSKTLQSGIIIENPYINIIFRRSEKKLTEYHVNFYKDCQARLDGYDPIMELDQSYNIEIDLDETEYSQLYNDLKTKTGFEDATDYQ